jgi:hypothetical protein
MNYELGIRADSFLGCSLLEISFLGGSFLAS